MELISLSFCVVLVPPPSQDKWPEQQEVSFYAPGQGPALPFLAEPAWVCPHRQGGVLILEDATSQYSGHFLDRWC